MSHSQRPVVSLPLLSSMVPHGESEIWVFYFELMHSMGLDHLFHKYEDQDKLGSFTRADQGENTRFYGNGTSNGWAFLRLTARQTARQTQTEGCEDPSEPTPLENKYVVRVYDLDGFLECMEKEGRPMPNIDTVRVLRERFTSTNPRTGQKWLTFLPKLKLEDIWRGNASETLSSAQCIVS